MSSNRTRNTGQILKKSFTGKVFSPAYLFYLILLIIFLLSGCNETYARSGDCILTGTVMDAATGELLPGANIILSQGGRGASSDLQGRFYLKRLLPGKHEISISYIGYVTKKDTVNLVPGQSPHLYIRLKQQPIEMQEITVSARRSDMYRSVNLSRDALSNQEIRMTSSLVEPDLVRTLAHLPGVVMANDFNTRFYVRGGRGNENQVLVDGVTLHNPYHAFGLFSIFNPDAIKSVEIYRGIFPAKYSERLSSVTNVVLRDGNAQRFSGQGMISLATSKLLLEGPVLKWQKDSGRKWTYMLGGRRTYLDQIIRKVPFYFYDLSAKSVYDSGRKTRLILHGFFGLDRIRDKSDKDPVDFDWKNRAAGLQWYQFVSPGNTLNMSLNYSDFQTTVNDIDPSSDSADEQLRQLNRICETNFSSEWERQLNNSLGAVFGYSYSQFLIDEYLHSYYQNVFEQSWRDHFHQKAYLTIEGRWRNLGIFEFGLSGLYFKPVKKINWSPRLGLKWLASERWRIKAGAGRNYQALTTINDEDDAFVLFDAWIPSPADRPVPHADHFGLGIEFNNTSSIEADMELYYRRYGGLTRFNRTQMTGEPFYLDGRGESYGLEFRINYQLKKFYGFANYALGKATSEFFLRNQPMRHLNDFSWQSFPSAGDIRHIFDAVVGLRSRGKWDFSVSMTLQTGRPYTAYFGDFYYDCLPPGHTNPPVNMPLFYEEYHFPHFYTTNHVYSDKNSYRLPFYQRIDISAAREFDWLGMKCSVFVYVYNLLVRRNPAFIMASSNEIIYGLPIFPSFGLKFQF